MCSEPETWSASVLVALQDLLVVFTEEELRRVSRGAWTEAADSLVTRYADDVDWVQPTPFYKVRHNLVADREENGGTKIGIGKVEFLLQDQPNF